MGFGRFKRALGGVAKAMDSATSEPAVEAEGRRESYGFKDRFTRSGPGMLVGALRNRKKKRSNFSGDTGSDMDNPEGGYE